MLSEFLLTNYLLPQHALFCRPLRRIPRNKQRPSLSEQFTVVSFCFHIDIVFRFIGEYKVLREAVMTLAYCRLVLSICVSTL
jgi:hypothetical protein